MRALLAAFAAVSLAVPAAAQPAALPADLARAAHDYERAQIEGDRPALERLIADDFQLVGSDGSRVGKAEHIAEFIAEGFDLDPVTVREPVAHVWADGAALGGTVDLSGTSDGRAFSVTLRYVDVWARRDGRWVVVYGQANRVPKPAS